MYYRSGTGRLCCTGTRQTLHVHPPVGSTFQSEMALWPPSWKYDTFAIGCIVQPQNTPKKWIAKISASGIRFYFPTFSIYARSWALHRNSTLAELFLNGFSRSPISRFVKVI